MGAFKFRGAYNFLSTLSRAERRARGRRVFERQPRAGRCACGAPARHPRDDRDAVRRAGGQAGRDARVRRGDRSLRTRAFASRRDRAWNRRRSAARRSCHRSTIARIVAGAGTAALELLEDADPLDAIVVPVGGGGLMGGTAIAAHGIDASIAIYGVEPEAGDDFAQSLARGERVVIPAAENDRRRTADDRARRVDLCDRTPARTRRRHGER